MELEWSLTCSFAFERLTKNVPRICSCIQDSRFSETNTVLGDDSKENDKNID